MSERWAVAYEPNGAEQGRFVWVRDQFGDIIIFRSQWEAKKWMLTSSSLDCSKDDVVFINIPCVNPASGYQEGL
jgi:hypothetical protein